MTSKPGQRVLTAVLVVLIGVLSAAPALARKVRTRVRGRYLRTEVTEEARRPTFTCRLARVPGSYVTLSFLRRQRVTYREVKIYQAVWRIQSEGEEDPDDIEYQPIPDDFIRGEENLRVDTEPGGVFANSVFHVNGVRMETDDQGMAVDRDQHILALFDDLARRDADLVLKHADLGTKVVTVTRELLLRAQDDAPVDLAALSASDVLCALGLDFEAKRRVNRDGVSIQASVPDTVRAGERFEVSLTVTNAGPAPTSSVIGRAFSRHEWFAGRNFYIGAVPVEETVTFTRVFTVPNDARGGRAFMSIGIWDILGANTDQRVDLAVTVAARAPDPAQIP